MPTIQGSKDRKVATSFTPGGAVRFSNTFGLRSGSEFSCRSATEACTDCYAFSLERAYTNVRNVMDTNFHVMSSLSYDGMIDALGDILDEFEAKSRKWDAELLYRIHWDGDLFSETYARAWVEQVSRRPAVKFWIYTRDADCWRILIDANLSNLSVFHSVDETDQVLTGVNQLTVAEKLRDEYGDAYRPAVLAKTRERSQQIGKDLIGKPIAVCPELTGQIPLNGACARCRLCIDRKVNGIAFFTDH